MHATREHTMTFRFAFSGGIVLPEQLRQLFGLLKDSKRPLIRIGPFHTMEVSLDGCDLEHMLPTLRETAGYLVRTTRHRHSRIMLPPDIDCLPAGRECRDLADVLSGLVPSVSYPYYEILADGVPVESSDDDQARRHHVLHKGVRICIQPPPHHDTDFFSQDISIAPVMDGENLQAWQLWVGGGGGIIGGSPAIGGRISTLAGNCPPTEIYRAVEVVLDIHARYGDRVNPRRRRLKSLLAERGMDWFHAELVQWGVRLDRDALPVAFSSSGDLVPPNSGHRRLIYLPFHEITDRPGYPVYTKLVEFARRFAGTFRLTPQYNLMIVPAGDDDEERVSRLFSDLGLPGRFSPMRQLSWACRGAPYCKRGKAEASVFLPRLVPLVERMLGELGITGVPLVFRISGCPNGCPRPLFAELALVGRTKEVYDIVAGGSPQGNRLAQVVRAKVADGDVPAVLESFLKRFALERDRNERFGDWAWRTLVRRTPSGITEE